MKLDDMTRFAHPVLWTSTGDFSEGAFSSGEISVMEELTSGLVAIKVPLQIAHPDFLTLVNSKAAQAGVMVECAETYLSQLFPLPAAGGELQFVPGAVSGRVVIRPAIWSRQAIRNFRPKGVHPEFGEEIAEIATGSLLALADEQVIEVGRDKLAPLETIFDLTLNELVPEGEFQVDLDDEHIHIVAGRVALADISGMRNSREGRWVLLSAVYLPALMTVLSAIAGSGASYEGKRWYRIFTAKASSLGIDLENCEPLVAAQQMLKSPFVRTAAVYRKGQE